ncbi:Response regulator receiver domain-containing protein [Maridesulfovibrio ferrireducens]|uniref:Response regulator receiver domain-containing protein n=1 Tax=Maridesulfovibrio ferrireducens TaxID=246191 RepID=A0A1G9CS85_9BACT|nr:response regulator [Maridesulfovibrio ferrireducens]SDK54487.1 Response regulator receiver domain-containing protein [Maridesulfovibrio ferrireducens]
MSPVQEQLFFVLADDDPRLHEYTVSILREAGLLEKHESFYDPVSFLAFLKESEEEPDVILLDVHFEGSGLSGVDILPFIREEYPYIPVILLTGMDAEATDEAQSDVFTFFIPKPVTEDHLLRMLHFYLGKSKKSAEKISTLMDEMEEVKGYHQLLEQEVEELQTEQRRLESLSKGEKSDGKGFEKVSDILESLLTKSQPMPSFIADLEKLYSTQFKLFKKVIETLIRFDVQDSGTPGMNIHKVQGTQNVFSARLSRKVRLFYYSSAKTARKRLIRLDIYHDTKGMDKWIKNNYHSYAENEE